MAVCRPKQVEQLRNTGIINSSTRLRLVGSFYEFQQLELNDKRKSNLDFKISVLSIISTF
jgi:hypothetical protein